MEPEKKKKQRGRGHTHGHNEILARGEEASARGRQPLCRAVPEIHVKHWLNTGPALKCLIYISGASAASGKSKALPLGDSAVAVCVCESNSAALSWGVEVMKRRETRCGRWNGERK